MIDRGVNVIRFDKQPLAIVSVSGGKDSTAVALLAIEAGLDRRFVFADTGNEHELTLEYVHDYLPTVLGPIETVRADFTREIAGKRAFIENVWPTKGVPDEIVRRALAVVQATGNPFLDLCLWKGRFPSRKAQFCTQHLKRYPLDTYLFERMAEGFTVESWRGIRRDESRNRKDAPEREAVAEGFTIVQPIATWTAQQVVDFVTSHGVLLNALYKRGMGRVGCMPCINCNKDELLEISKRFPDHIDRIREWEWLVSWASKRGLSSFFCDAADEDETDEDVFDRVRIDSRVRWAQTARGGTQIDLTRQLEAATCSSLYGLCE